MEDATNKNNHKIIDEFKKEEKKKNVQIRANKETNRDPNYYYYHYKKKGKTGFSAKIEHTVIECLLKKKKIKEDTHGNAAVSVSPFPPSGDHGNFRHAVLTLHRVSFPGGSPDTFFLSFFLFSLLNMGRGEKKSRETCAHMSKVSRPLGSALVTRVPTDRCRSPPLQPPYTLAYFYYCYLFYIYFLYIYICRISCDSFDSD